MGIYLIFRRSEWKSGLIFWRFSGGRANKKRPRLTAKGDAQHRDTTLLRRFLAKSGLMERPHAPVL